MSLTKIVRTPNKATGGITPAEKVQIDAYAQKWIAQAMRTGPTDHDALTDAIARLYAAAGLKRPRIVIVPSPLVMAMAGGISAAWWYLNNGSATVNATAVKNARNFTASDPRNGPICVIEPRLHSEAATASNNVTHNIGVAVGDNRFHPKRWRRRKGIEFLAADTQYLEYLMEPSPPFCRCPSGAEVGYRNT